MGDGMTRVVAVVVVVMVVILNGANAMTFCNVTDEGYTACKPSMTPPAPVPPSPECCNTVSGADFKCLCSYKNSFLLAALGIDPHLALALPTKCNVHSPTQC